MVEEISTYGKRLRSTHCREVYLIAQDIVVVEQHKTFGPANGCKLFLMGKSCLILVGLHFVILYSEVIVSFWCLKCSGALTFFSKLDIIRTRIQFVNTVHLCRINSANLKPLRMQDMEAVKKLFKQIQVLCYS